MVDAMMYEYLVRRAYRCGRYGVAGADADLYRSYERKEILYRIDKRAIKDDQPRTSNEPFDEIANEAGFATGVVVAHIESSIQKVLKEYEESISGEQRNGLNECLNYLLEPSTENIEGAIEKATEIMVELEIFPG